MFPLHFPEFLNTNLKARKKIQYNIAAKNKTDDQKNSPRKYKRNINTIENIIHTITESIAPPIPSRLQLESQNQMYQFLGFYQNTVLFFLGLKYFLHCF